MTADAFVKRDVTIGQQTVGQGAPIAEELRQRAAAWVNAHVDVWVAVEGAGTLVLAGAEPAVLLRAGAEWLEAGPAYRVADVRWTPGAGAAAGEPEWALRLDLELPPSE